MRKVRKIGEEVPVERNQQATSTSWGSNDDEGTYALMLENEHGEVFAIAAYSFDSWISVFQNLLKISKEIGEAND